MFQTARNDNDVAIDVSFSTKSFNQKIFHKSKRYFNPTFQFKDVTTSGALNGEIIVDGAVSEGTFTVNQQVVGGAGMGASLMGFTLPGEADAGVQLADSVSSDIVQEAYMSPIGRAIKYAFTSEKLNFNYKLVSFAHTYQLLPLKRLSETQRSYVG